MGALWTAWGLKGLAYAAILGLLAWGWRRATVQRDQARAERDGYMADLRNADATMTELRNAVASWRYAANAATEQAVKAQQEAAAGRARFDELQTKILATPVPADAAGALGWLAEVAKDISKGVAP